MESVQNDAVGFARSASLGLPGSIKDVADYLLSEGTGIAPLSMKQLAARTYTSKSTLVRFAKMAGYEGWTAYRRDFLAQMGQVEAQRANDAEVDVNQPFPKGAPVSEVLDAMSRVQALAVREVQRRVDANALELAAQAILRANRVAFIGAMQNRDRGRVLASNLGLIGIMCHVPTHEQAAMLAQMLGEGDCAIVASYSGDLAHMPMSVVPALMRRGVTIVAITNSERSQLGTIAHHTFGFAPLEHLHKKIGAFYSGACTSMMMDLLYAACYAGRYEQAGRGRSDALQVLEGLIPSDFACVGGTEDLTHWPKTCES